ncbi:hypothetical protein COO60DRAFT_417658 [Scenedesmus sp. NREL 46B-D3]|nr:hypothetical protein COO60DRAFT_417658 [Scenedesmus sp. NREL 46B-D3]
MLAASYIYLSCCWQVRLAWPITNFTCLVLQLFIKKASRSCCCSGFPHARSARQPSSTTMLLPSARGWRWSRCSHGPEAVTGQNCRPVTLSGTSTAA